MLVFMTFNLFFLVRYNAQKMDSPIMLYNKKYMNELLAQNEHCNLIIFFEIIATFKYVKPNCQHFRKSIKKSMKYLIEKINIS